MDYKKIYDQFIADRLLKYPSKKRAKGRELHHIVPRGGEFGGSDAADNLVILTRSDHLFAHRLLAKIYGGPMSSAFYLMLHNPRYKGRQSRKMYEIARADAIEVARGNIRLAHGLPRTEAQKAQMKIVWAARSASAKAARESGTVPARSAGQIASVEKARKSVSPERLEEILKKARAANVVRMNAIRAGKSKPQVLHQQSAELDIYSVKENTSC